jgi:hypothetical protein
MGNSELVPLARIKIEINLRQLTGIDNAGRELLLAMRLGGVRLIVEVQTGLTLKVPRL